MALYLGFNNKYNNSYLHDQKIQWQNINFELCSQYLRKVSLKVDDVKMKLGLKKIVDFMEKQSSLQIIDQNVTLVDLQNQNVRETSCFFRINNEEFMPTHNQQVKNLTFVDVQTSKTLSDDTLLMKSSDSVEKQNYQELAHFGNFNCKYTKTKNNISQKTYKYVKTESDDYEIQKLAQENKKLGNCLKTIFCLLQEKKIVHMSKSLINKHSKGTFSDVVEVISQNCDSYQTEIQTKINQLSEYTKQLQESLKIYNISINNRSTMQKSMQQQTKQMTQSKEIQVSSFALSSKQIQVQVQSSKSIDESSQVHIIYPQPKVVLASELNEYIEQCKEIKEKLQEAQRQKQRNEQLMNAKDQQILALNAVVSELQSKLQIYQKPVDFSTTKKYKKFFQLSATKLNQTVS